MYVFVGHGIQLRHIAANELALRVKFFGLRNWIEDAEIRLCITARRRCPLPATVIGRQIKIIQVQGEIRLSTLPRYAEILGQE